MAVSDEKLGSQLEMAGPADTSPCVWAAPQLCWGEQTALERVLYLSSSCCLSCTATLASPDAMRSVFPGKVMVGSSFLATVKWMS